MYKAVEQIQKLQKEKQDVLKSVYQSSDPDEVYKRQSALGSMAITIFTDAANAVMPVLKEDGVNNIVWSYISLHLEQLSFISIPTKSEIYEKYKKCTNEPAVVNIKGRTPEVGAKIKVKKKFPAFLVALAATGIAVPIILNIFGVRKLAMVVIDVAVMTIEVVAYIGRCSGNKKRTVFVHRKQSSESLINYDEMYEKAIQEVHKDNLKRLNAWFANLKKATEDEINKALKKTEE